ncbi:hypothetical protein Tco_0079582 [Tanacetum coccineum]
MSTNEQTPPSQPTSAMRNTLGKEQVPQDLQEKLKAVKARLNFEEASRHSESGTPSRRRNLKERIRPRHVRSVSESPESRHGRSRSPRKKDPERRSVFKRLEKGVFHRPGDKEKNIETEIASEKHRHKRESPQRTEALSESEGSARYFYQKVSPS